MTKALTVRELINGAQHGFDPMSINTTKIQELSQSFPSDGNIEISNAEALATKYLKGADLCSELLAIATAHVAKTKSKKEIAYNRAFVKYKDDKSVKTDKMRIALSELDDDYIEACNAYNEALAFTKWIDSKYGNFIKMHYHCRAIVKRATEHEGAANWDGTSDDNDPAW